uniref:DUF6537 domain-containing protein n=1 Tax=Paracoccus sphaerophysae TaxID=690417 RepID=UPI0030811AC3
IELNGAKAEENKRAFQIGRWAALHPAEAQPVAAVPQAVDPVAYRAERLVGYQGERLKRRFLKLVDLAPPELRETVADSWYRLLAIKDEYEVARLHLTTAENVARVFEGDTRLTFHLAPPFLPGRTPEGRPQKRDFGAWMLPLFRGLAAMRGLRGTPLDVFGWQGERRRERALAAQYERDMAELLPKVTPATLETARELAALPQQIRGYGFIKDAAMEKAAVRRAELLAEFRAGGRPTSAPMAMAAE